MTHGIPARPQPLLKSANPWQAAVAASARQVAAVAPPAGRMATVLAPTRRAATIIALIVAAVPALPSDARAQVPWGGSAQLGAFVVDDRLGAALGAEWTLPIGTLDPERPAPGPRRVHARPWSVVLSAAAGPSADFDPGDLGFTLIGTSAIQRRLNSSLRAGVGLAGVVGDGRGVGLYLRADYEGIVVVKSGWMDRAGHHSGGSAHDDGPFLSVMLDWALLRDSGG